MSIERHDAEQIVLVIGNDGKFYKQIMPLLDATVTVEGYSEEEVREQIASVIQGVLEKRVERIKRIDPMMGDLLAQFLGNGDEAWRNVIAAKYEEEVNERAGFWRNPNGVLIPRDEM